MPEVKSRKTVIVKAVIDIPATFDIDFRIGFDVDDMIVTSWTADTPTAGGDQSYIMKLDGVGELFHFRAEDSVAIKNVFRLGKSLEGIQTFTVIDYHGNVEDETEGLVIMFTLEFIEFHK